MTTWTTLCSGLGTALVYGTLLIVPGAMVVEMFARTAGRLRLRTAEARVSSVDR